MFCGGSNQVAEGAGPAAQKQQRGHAAHVDHVGVLGHEEHGELHRAVFGVIAAGQFAFGFGQIEGRAVGLGIGGHQVDEEGQELHPPKMFQVEEAQCGLLLHNTRRLSDPARSTTPTSERPSASS